MRFVSFLLIITLSQFSNGQNVLTKFQDTLVYDDFIINSFNFPQKYTSQEISIIEDNSYLIKRLSTSGQSISYFKYDKPLATYEISMTIEFLKSKNSEASAGLLLNGQTTGSGGVFVEIDRKKKFRITRSSGAQVRLLSGLPVSEGWQKGKGLKKRKSNKLTVKFESGNYDIYLNDRFVYTSFDDKYSQGKVGIIVGASSQVRVTDFMIRHVSDKLYLPKTKNGENGSTENENAHDEDFEAVILLFKTKMDKQRETITRLNSELDLCKSMLNYDTAIVSRATSLESINRILTKDLDKAIKELEKNAKRLAYLESLEDDIEGGDNGDLLLKLTAIISDLKKENRSLKIKEEVAEGKNRDLKNEKAALIKEIEKMKYMLNLKD